MDDHNTAGEKALIERYFTPLAKGLDGSLNLKDDAGLLESKNGVSFVLTADAIVEGVHYLAGTAPSDIAYKALAVNISDLCAKGAEPAVYLLALALPRSCGGKFLSGLRDGLGKAQQDFNCALLGGDTVRTDGPTVLSITAVGEIPAGKMVHRFGAQPGDLVYVTGTIGDAALGLQILKSGEGAHSVPIEGDNADHLKNRYWRPQPRMDAIPLVRNFASASMDVSDGLVGDFEKLASASGVGGMIEAGNLPLSEAAAAWLANEPTMIETIMTGGDDYEILMTVAPDKRQAFESAAHAKGVPVTNIGTITSTGTKVCVKGADGKALKFSQSSYDHF